MSKLRSTSDQNIKNSMIECIRWIFSTSDDTDDMYGKYLGGWKAWSEFGVKNVYYTLMTGWVMNQFRPDTFIEAKRFDSLLKQAVEEELNRNKE